MNFHESFRHLKMGNTVCLICVFKILAQSTSKDDDVAAKQAPARRASDGQHGGVSPAASAVSSATSVSPAASVSPQPAAVAREGAQPTTIVIGDNDVVGDVGGEFAYDDTNAEANSGYLSQKINERTTSSFFCFRVREEGKLAREKKQLAEQQRHANRNSTTLRRVAADVQDKRKVVAQVRRNFYFARKRVICAHLDAHEPLLAVATSQDAGNTQKLVKSEHHMFL
jgi:hypothetical protein